jgi:hypothetical protein
MNSMENNTRITPVLGVYKALTSLATEPGARKGVRARHPARVRAFARKPPSTFS